MSNHGPTRRQVDFLATLAQELGHPSAKAYCAYLAPVDQYRCLTNWTVPGVSAAISEAIKVINRRRKLAGKKLMQSGRTKPK